MRPLQRGQATVELAVALPVVVVFLLAIVQVASVVRDAVALTAAARAAARRVIVDPDPGAARAAAVSETRLASDRLTVTVTGDRAAGGLAVVTVRYRSPTDVPVVGRVVPDVMLTERFTVRRE